MLRLKVWEGVGTSDVDALDDVFERFVGNAKIFKDREVLRHDYLPDRLPHREEQVRRLGETVAPVLKGARGSNLFIYGKTGTGKTAVTRYVLSHLEFRAKEFNAPVRFCYVNCRMAGIRLSRFRESLSKHGCIYSFHRLVCR